MKRLYLGRTDGSFIASSYELGTSKKDWDAVNGFKLTHLIGFCLELFEKLINIKLKPGEIRKVESIKFKLAPIKKGKK